MCPWSAMKPETAALFRALSHVMQSWHSLTPGEGLTRAQFHTLAAIARITDESPDRLAHPTSGHLAGALRVSPAAVSQNLRALEEMGCIERAAHSADRRITSVRLTPKGEHLLWNAFTGIAHTLDTALASVSSEEVRTTTQSVERVAGVLDTIAKENRECSN